MNDQIFYITQRLEHYKKINPKIIDPDSDAGQYGDNRHTYCHLMVCIRPDEKPYEKGWHKFEVRAFQTTMDYSRIELSCVNWTIAAGTCTITIDEINCMRFKILEDERTMQVLYG